MFFPRLLCAIIASSFLTLIATAFSFSVGTPSECDPLSFTWSGGIPPFQLLMIPPFGTPRNLSIPSNAFSNGAGSFSIQSLPISQTKPVLFTMSDATGFGTGGTTSVLTVQSGNGVTCDTKDPGVDFEYELNTALQQCRPYIFSDYDRAIQPVTILGIVPSGTFFKLQPPLGSKEFAWTANVAQGTSMVFIMTDALGRQGGSSDVKIIGNSDDQTCLNYNSPSSTSATIISTSSKVSQTATSTSSSESSSTSAASSGGISIGAVAGTVIGGLLFMAVVVTLGLFFLKRRQKSRTHGRGGNGGFRRDEQGLDSEVDFTYGSNQQPGANAHHLLPGASSASLSTTNYPFPPNDHVHSDPYALSSNRADLATASSPYQPYLTSPFQDQPNSGQYQLPSHYQQQSYPSSNYYPESLPDSHSDPFNPYLSSPPPEATLTPYPPRSVDQSAAGGSTTTSHRKAALAGVSAYKPSRFIVHTDVEDDLPPPNADGVVELPPQYSERRGPLTVANPLNPTPTSLNYDSR